MNFIIYHKDGTSKQCTVITTLHILVGVATPIPAKIAGPPPVLRLPFIVPVPRALLVNHDGIKKTGVRR